MKIGDWVTYRWSGGTGEGFVLGEMAYSKPTSVVILLGDFDKLGMPIAAGHCTVSDRADPTSAPRLRLRYDTRFPGALKPLKRKAP